MLNTILQELPKAKNKESYNKELFKSDAKKVGNEFLFILKPEVFCHLNKDQISKIIELVFSRFKKFGFQVDNIRMINASNLKAENTISNHYGIINAISRNWKKNITKEAENNFHKIYNKDIYDVKVFGSLEILESEIGVDEEILTELWKDCKIERLAGGIYSGKVKHSGEDLYILNGFHPPQLSHFIADERVIVSMNLSGNVDWKIAREDFIGNTYPEKALPGTIRRYLFDNYAKMGFEEVSYVINSVHLSAGPLEGLIELMRFNKEKPSQYIFGNSLLKNFNQNIYNKIISNPIVNYKGKEISLFDLTEEKNAEEALIIFKEIY